MIIPFRSHFFWLVPVVLFFLCSCARLPENHERSTSFVLEVQKKSKIGRQWQAALKDRPSQSAYHLLANGYDALLARGLIAEQAEFTIDAQYYLLHNDKVGKMFIHQLLKAAARGVRVRLLLDDMGLEGQDRELAVIDAFENVEVRIFNPFGRNTTRLFQFVTGFGKQTRRAHNKSFTVDNVATILGGRNIGNEYFIADPDLDFYDLDVLVVGPVAQEVSGSFDQFWNHPLSYPITTLIEYDPPVEELKSFMTELTKFVADQYDTNYFEQLRHSNLAMLVKNNESPHVWGEGVVVGDNPQKLTTSPDDTRYHLSEELRPFLSDIQTELLILSPYFIPGKAGVAFFKSLRQRGVEVTIVTNSLASTDVPIVHSGYANYRRQLLRIGINLYELNSRLSRQERAEMAEGTFYESKSSLHAKAMVLDRRNVFIGSLNLDPRSVKQNTEIGIVIESEEMAEYLAQSLQSGIDRAAFRLELRKDEDNFEYILWHGYRDGNYQVMRSEPYTGFWERFIMGFLRLVPAESQL